MLSSRGASTQSVSGASEAIAALSAAAKSGYLYRAMVVDLDMPHMDGLQMLRMLWREQPALLESTAVVMLTPVDYPDLQKLQEVNVQVRDDRKLFYNRMVCEYFKALCLLLLVHIPVEIL